MVTGAVHGDDPTAASSAGAVPELASLHCRNCGARAPGTYCPQCGQETVEPPAISEFFHGSLVHFLSLESKAWQTLIRLLFAPGLLTVEYLAGRRARYIRPLRLYLWISVFTIAVVESLGLNLGLRSKRASYRKSGRETSSTSCYSWCPFSHSS